MRYNSDKYGWIMGLVLGVIGMLTIVALAVIIHYYCKAQPIREHGFMAIKESRFPAYNKL